MLTLENYVRKLREKCKGEGGHDFLKSLVLAYLRQEIYPSPIDVHSNREKGRDIFFCHSLPLGLGELNFAVIIHNDEINMRVSSKKSVQRVMDQIIQSFENPIDIGGCEGEMNKNVDVIIVVATKITKPAQEEIRNKIKLGARNIIFHDGFTLVSEIYHYKRELLKEFLGDE